jgi:hypothetical protein
MFGPAMTAPCKSQAAAIAQAVRMADAIRRHGVAVEIVVDAASAEEEAPEKLRAKAATGRKAGADAIERPFTRA